MIRMLRSPLRCFGFVLLGAMALTQPMASQTVRDSAGVRIIINERPEWTGTGWRLRSEPLLDIGVADGKPEYELHDVMGAVRLSNGTVVIANMASANLRYYDPNGRYLFAAGRSGQGPGEFQQLMGVAAIRGDTVVGNNAFRGWELFTSSGKYVRSVRTTNDPQRKTASQVAPEFWLADGSAFGSLRWESQTRSGRTRWTDSMTLAHVDRLGAIVTQLPGMPSTERAITQGRTMTVQFGPRGHLATSADKLYFMFGDDYSIRVMSPSGRVEQIIRRTWTPRRITDSEMKAWTEHYTNPSRETVEPGASPTGIRALRLRNIETMTFSATLPSTAEILVDADGNVWVRESYVADYFARGGWGQVPDSATRWSIFNALGRWLGDMTMPARFRALQITRDAVLGLARDDDDVEHVRLYRIDKGAK
jgi:hypothetical protein